MTAPAHRALWRRGRRLAVAVAASVTTWWAAPLWAPAASAGTLTDTIQFEGGSFSEPIMNKLLIDDQNSLGSMHVAYFDTNLDTGRSDFVSGADDVAVSELPLTSAETTAAAAKGVAYVPFAASADAIGYALACFVGGPIPYVLCPNLQMTALQTEEVFTGAASQWTDPRLSTISGGKSGISPINQDNVYATTAIDPSASNLGLQTYLDTDPASKSAWTTWVTGPEHQTNTAPTERWPTDNGLDGGDYVLSQALIPISPDTGKPPSSLTAVGTADNVAPLPVDWLGPPGNVPAMAVQNAAGAFVAPTKAAETAALNDATMDSSNIVTFPPEGGSDAAAYPIMEMSYLIVPTKGLSPAKATALAQYIRFLATPTAATDIENMGAVPPTAAMLKADAAVATQVAAEASPPTTTTTSTPTASALTTTGSPGSTSPSTASALTSSESGVGSGSDSVAAADAGVALAYTGANVWPLLGVGMALALVGFWGRRRLRKPAGQT